jgi:hypothetical protein
MIGLKTTGHTKTAMHYGRQVYLNCGLLGQLLKKKSNCQNNFFLDTVLVWIYLTVSKLNFSVVQ